MKAIDQIKEYLASNNINSQEKAVKLLDVLKFVNVERTTAVKAVNKSNEVQNHIEREGRSNISYIWLNQDNNKQITNVISQQKGKTSNSLIIKNDKKPKNKDIIVNEFDEYTLPHEEFLKKRQEGKEILDQYNNREIEENKTVKAEYENKIVKLNEKISNLEMQLENSSKTDNPKGKFYRDLALKFELGLDYNRDELRFLVRYLQIECLPYNIKVFMSSDSKILIKNTLKVLEELKTRNLYDKIF